METGYEITISGAKTDKTKLEATTRENINQIISQRERIIRKHAIPNPPQTLTLAASEAKKYILGRFNHLGIPLKEEEIPEVVFVAWENKKKLENALQDYGGASLDDQRGSSSVFNGVSVVFFKDDITDLDQAGIILHEMIHSVGIQIIAANEAIAIYGRQGLEIFGIKSRYKPWILEEGLVAYEAGCFVDYLSNHESFQEDIKNRQQKFLDLQQKGKTSGEKIKFDSGMEVETSYCWLMDPKNKTAFGLPTNTGVSASLFNLLLNKYAGEERQNFFKTVYQARKNPRTIPQLAKTIDEKWGKGTYSRLLKCERTEKAVWEIIKDLSARQS